MPFHTGVVKVGGQRPADLESKNKCHIYRVNNDYLLIQEKDRKAYDPHLTNNTVCSLKSK